MDKVIQGIFFLKYNFFNKSYTLNFCIGLPLKFPCRSWALGASRTVLWWLSNYSMHYRFYIGRNSFGWLFLIFHKFQHVFSFLFLLLFQNSSYVLKSQQANGIILSKVILIYSTTFLQNTYTPSLFFLFVSKQFSEEEFSQGKNPLSGYVHC